VTKCEGERAAAAWPRHLIVRTCGLYARPSHLAAKNFVKTILRLAQSKPKLRVVDDQRCTPSYVPHIARAIAFLIGANASAPAPWGIYNVTNRGETTWCGFAREIVRLAGLAVPVEPITTAEFAAPAPRPAYSVLDTTAYHRLGGPVMPDWKEALAEYFEELKQVE
jgi:dTDP-4-dehydrorhamnose reductase